VTDPVGKGRYIYLTLGSFLPLYRAIAAELSPLLDGFRHLNISFLDKRSGVGLRRVRCHHQRCTPPARPPAPRPCPDSKTSYPQSPPSSSSEEDNTEPIRPYHAQPHQEPVISDFPCFPIPSERNTTASLACDPDLPTSPAGTH